MTERQSAANMLRYDLASGNVIRNHRALKHQCAAWMTICLIAVTVSISAGCSSSTQGAKAPDPITVEVVEVEQKDVPIYTEWIGTTDGVVNADIKAQVSGYEDRRIRRRNDSNALEHSFQRLTISNDSSTLCSNRISFSR